MTICKNSRRSYGYTMRRAFGRGGLTIGITGKHPGLVRWLRRSPTKEQAAVKAAIEIEQARRRVTWPFLRRCLLWLRSLMRKVMDFPYLPYPRGTALLLVLFMVSIYGIIVLIISLFQLIF